MKNFGTCFCVTCDKAFHPLGIMMHRAMHRRRKEDCTIEMSTGKAYKYNFSGKKDENKT